MNGEAITHGPMWTWAISPWTHGVSPRFAMPKIYGRNDALRFKKATSNGLRLEQSDKSPKPENNIALRNETTLRREKKLVMSHEFD